MERDSTYASGLCQVNCNMAGNCRTAAIAYHDDFATSPNNATNNVGGYEEVIWRDSCHSLSKLGEVGNKEVAQGTSPIKHLSQEFPQPKKHPQHSTHSKPSVGKTIRRS